MSWDKDKGIWSWWIFRGTTPRNAGIWTLDIVVGKYELWIGTGNHAYATFFSGPEEKWSIEREPEECDCYGCGVSHWRISPEVASAMVEAMRTARHKHFGQDSFDRCADPDKCDGMLPPREVS